MPGTLVVVGSGIKSIGHLSKEAELHIKAADQVLYLVVDAITENYIKSLNENSESLKGFYIEGKQRSETYEDMKSAILTYVRLGKKVCAVFYGHPGVFVTPSHEAIAVARSEGYKSTMLPGISAEDCLFADLGIDPALQGCQSYEATHFLLQDKVFDKTAALILWQVGTIGDPLYTPRKKDFRGIELLSSRLMQHYPKSHEVCMYEAALFSVDDPVIKWFPLSNLSRAGVEFTGISTLFVPPLADGPPNETLLSEFNVSIRKSLPAPSSR